MHAAPTEQESGQEGVRAEEAATREHNSQAAAGAVGATKWLTLSKRGLELIGLAAEGADGKEDGSLPANMIVQ